MLEYQERLRKMALSDDRFLTSVLGMGRETIEASGLDPKTHAMVTLAALLSINAAESSYNASAEVALAAGASLDEIVGILVAIAPAIGLGRVVSAAPGLGLALGYDVEAALEALPETDGRFDGRSTRNVDGGTR
ncbi:MAG TPA: carboxymuconolactone decarboxylase family protein [Solirubrobacteraceae bacterium]|nr:carboxymuconolactone decarboxylase family protein [Solirubrobacteraceae bacterium]